MYFCLCRLVRFVSISMVSFGENFGRRSSFRYKNFHSFSTENLYYYTFYIIIIIHFCILQKKNDKVHVPRANDEASQRLTEISNAGKPRWE